MEYPKTDVLPTCKEELYRNSIERAAKLLSENQIVAFPTETVYGLGANSFSDSAVQKIFKAKGRPSDNPLIIHLADIPSVESLIERKLEGIERKLAQNFWPGPLSIIFEDKKNKNSEKGPFGLSRLATCGLNTAALRVPKNRIAKDILNTAKLPIAAPSANKSGRPSPTVSEHVLRDLNGLIPAIVDGGRCSIGLESTVVTIKESKVFILREGGITKEMLENVVGKENILDSFTPFKKGKPLCPGTKYRHYAPNAKLKIIETFEKNTFVKTVEKEILKVRKIGIICDKDFGQALRKAIKETSVFIFDLGEKDDLETIAKNLFASLRCMDNSRVELILSQSFERKGIGAAVMNRLEKASFGQENN